MHPVSVHVPAEDDIQPGRLEAAEALCRELVMEHVVRIAELTGCACRGNVSVPVVVLTGRPEGPLMIGAVCESPEHVEALRALLGEILDQALAETL